MTDLRKMSVFRDVQVAMDFQKMAENGYLDEEFTMYGCVYIEQNKRQYLISSEELKIVMFIQNAIKKGIYPSPIETMTKVCHVPLGEKETISNTVKLDLARRMQQDYPIEFFSIFMELCEQDNSDEAFSELNRYVKRVRNSFSQNNIMLAENLILLAYESKVLQADSYQKLMQILEKEKKKMQDDTIVKDLLHKTFYTIMYEEDTVRYATNARMEWIEKKKNTLKVQGKIVSPVYYRVYWYNNQLRLKDVQLMHKNNYLNDLNEDYFALVKKIYHYSTVFDKNQYQEKMQYVQENYGDKCVKMLSYYGYLWHVL